jgi:hypothetical protein
LDLEFGNLILKITRKIKAADSQIISKSICESAAKKLFIIPKSPNYPIPKSQLTLSSFPESP